MYKIHGKAFIDGFFGFHNITRFLVSEHKIGSQWYYNIPVVFIGFFPWSVFLPAAFWHMFKMARRAEVIFTLAWFAVIFVFFSASSTKLPTYVFPSFIALALMTGVFMDDFLKNTASGATAVSMKVSYYLLFAMILLGSVAAILFIRYRYPAISNGVAVSAVFLAVGMFLSFAAFIGRRFTAAFILVIVSVMAFMYPLSALVLPQVERLETSKEISAVLSSVMKKGEALGSESNYMAGLAFYTGIFPKDIDRHHDLYNLMNSKERIWCVLKEKNHRQFYELDTEPLYVKPSYMIYRLGKKAIITNMMPGDGKYILMRERSSK
jgi:4-amino-4-deoxy-L-arabinose transferase-like glycosyltransferase